jgi:hypothetical protein
MTASPGVPDGDIRWQFELAGNNNPPTQTTNDLVDLLFILQVAR